MTNYENTKPDIRPIDANALCEALKDWRGDAEDIDENDVHDIVYYKAMNRAIRISEGAPTLYYAPVRHGEWLDCENYNDIAQCSQCGLIRNIYKQEGWSYFPNCGVKMDGVKKNDTGTA